MTGKDDNQRSIMTKKTVVSSKYELLRTFIEFGSKPTAFILIGLMILIWLLTLQGPITNLFNRATNVQFGKLIQVSASKAGVSGELQKLTSLTQEQIQLFLIIGTIRSKSISYFGPEITKENIKKLEEIGLLSNVKIDSLSDNISWKVTQQAFRLHSLLMDQIVLEIENSKNYAGKE